MVKPLPVSRFNIGEADFNIDVSYPVFYAEPFGRVIKIDREMKGTWCPLHSILYISNEKLIQKIEVDDLIALIMRDTILNPPFPPPPPPVE